MAGAGWGGGGGRIKTKKKEYSKEIIIKSDNVCWCRIFPATQMTKPEPVWSSRRTSTENTIFREAPCKGKQTACTLYFVYYRRGKNAKKFEGEPMLHLHARMGEKTCNLVQ